MKNIIFASLLLCMTAAQAQTLSKKELVKMSLDRLFPDGENKETFADMREVVTQWNKLFDEQNYKRDKNKHRMDWQTLFPIQKDRVHEITGKRVFYNLAVKKYRYRIIEDARSNSLIVNVKMHFFPSKTYLKRAAKGVASYDKEEILMEKVRQNVLSAEKHWNSQAPKGVKFQFEMVDSANDADYSLKLISIFAALYDSFIMAPAYADILSHEVGHMMGLDDEYSVVTSNIIPYNELKKMTGSHPDRHSDYSAYKDMRCNLESIMCLREKVYPYHLDHILGRIEL